MYCLHISYLYLHITVGDPEVNLGGGGDRGPSGGRYGRGFQSYWWGFRGSHPRECWKNEAKRYNLECKSSLCNPFKLRCFSSKIAQNIFIYCQEIPLILLHCQWRMDPEEGIVNQSRCKTVVSVCEGISLYIKSVRPPTHPPPNLAESVSFFFLWHFKFFGGP